MKLKLINIDASCENEHDYETAIEMSHSTVNETIYTLETLSGLKLILSETQIHTSYSYLEPNWDALEENSNNLYYELTGSSDKSKHDIFSYFFYQEEKKTVIMSKDDYKSYFTNYEGKSWSEKETIDDINRNKFQQYESLCYPNEQECLSTDVEIIQKMLKNIDSVLNLSSGKKYKKGMFYEIEIPQEFKKMIEKLDEENMKTKVFNDLYLLSNRANEAQARIELEIEKSYQKALVQMKSYKSY